MATLDQIKTFVLGNPDLKQRFGAGRVQAAWNILAETSPSAQRTAWRNKIFNDVTGADIDREYIWFLSHTNVQTAGTSITDANMMTAIMSFVDAWAAIP